MSTYVALLRGVNVGAHKRMKMADLKAVYESLGFAGVQTYIQSGNVLFQSPEAETALRPRIEQATAAAFGFPVTTILRTADELAAVVTHCPFPVAGLAEGENLHVSFLAEAPTEGALARLPAPTTDGDEFRILGRDVYLFLRQSIRETRFTNNFFENKLKVPATARNWQTTAALAELAKAMSAGKIGARK